MSERNDFASIGEIYGSMLNGVKKKLVSEGKIGKVSPGEIGEAPLISGGPQEKGGFQKPLIDKKNAKSKKENAYNIDNLSQDCGCEEDEETKHVFTSTFKAARKQGKSKKAASKIAGAAKAKYEGEEVAKEDEKMVKESINNFMRKKSIFDRLYENVMNPGPLGGGAPGAPGAEGDEMNDADELDALGIEGGEDVGEEGGDEITITLNRELAQKLHDALMGVLGEEEAIEDEGYEEEGIEDEDMEDEGYEEDEEDLGASNLSKEINYGKNNKVGNLKTQTGGAESKYTDKVGTDGDHGHAIYNAKQPNFGKNNKVGTLKTGKSAFEQ